MSPALMAPEPPGKRSVNTLIFRPGRCVNCGMCLRVCPHRVFAPGPERVRLANAGRCMECGACQRNCPVGAIEVQSGVGCASAMIMAALRGKEEGVCGEDCCR